MTEHHLTTATVDLPEFLAKHNGPVRLHLGCGGMRWKDFVNVDLYPIAPDQVDSSRSGCIADAWADMRSLGLSDDAIDEIFTAHTLDHFTKWVATDMLSDWFRMLKPGGRLVIEVADFRRCVLWLFHPSKKKRNFARSQFYGNQWDRIDFETHRYLWSRRELTAELRDIGFVEIRSTHQTLTHVPGRDMHVEAIKPQ